MAGGESLRARVGGEARDLRLALRRLEAAGFCHRQAQDEATPTLLGLAAAVATAAAAKTVPSRGPRRRKVVRTAAHVVREAREVRPERKVLHLRLSRRHAA